MGLYLATIDKTRLRGTFEEWDWRVTRTVTGQTKVDVVAPWREAWEVSDWEQATGNTGRPMTLTNGDVVTTTYC
jgi:hypothetical protein